MVQSWPAACSIARKKDGRLVYRMHPNTMARERRRPMAQHVVSLKMEEATASTAVREAEEDVLESYG